MKFKIIKDKNGYWNYFILKTRVPKSSKLMGFASTPEQAKDMIEKNLFKPRVILAGKLFKLDLWDPIDLERARAISKGVNFLPVN